MIPEHYQKIVEHCQTPTFIYSGKTLKDNIKRIKDAAKETGLGDVVDIHVAYFTNSHPTLFRICGEQGTGTTLQSREELHQLEAFGLSAQVSMVSPMALSDADLEYFLQRGLQVNVSLPEEIESVIRQGGNVGVRVDISAEQNQRTGFKIFEFNQINVICEKWKKQIHAMHTYPGTGSNLEKLILHAEEAFKACKQFFPGVKEINLGGGFAFDYDKDSLEEKHFPWMSYFTRIKKLLDTYQLRDVRIAIEPGRDIFADTGEFLTSVQRVHTRTNQQVQQVYTDGSYVFMPSATIRTRKHRVSFLDAQFNKKADLTSYAELNGCTTLSSDFLFPGVIRAPVIRKGDYVVVHDIGAYGACQHMEFLNKRPAAEVLIREDEAIQIISRRGDFTDRVRYALRDRVIISD